MHIPDGYLGPQTYIPFYGIMIPAWYWASRILKKTLNARQIPFLALGAAFSFVIMMFNIPIPGGSSGHAVGAALIAIILGPWAAFMAVSMALIIQALLFGDGGITAIGANCFNMALVMSFSSYYIYKFLSSGAGTNINRRVFAACVAGYVSINICAFLTALEFGIQPMIAHASDGTPLYGPYGLNVAIPIMTIEHLAFFGFIEALVTGIVVRHIAKTDPSMLKIPGAATEGSAYQVPAAKTSKRLWIGLGILIILTPLGLLASGTAWGEWGADELLAMFGFVPERMEGLMNFWQSLLPDYAVAGMEGPLGLAVGYILSAIMGTAVIILSAFILGKLIFREK